MTTEALEKQETGEKEEMSETTLLSWARVLVEQSDLLSDLNKQRVDLRNQIAKVEETYGSAHDLLITNGVPKSGEAKALQVDNRVVVVSKPNATNAVMLKIMPLVSLTELPEEEE